MVTFNLTETLAKLEKDVLHLQRQVKEAVTREKALTNRVTALSRQLASLETAHTMLRGRVSQLPTKR